MNLAAEFDVVVYGATGFTGRLVSEYLLARYGPGGELRWAMAGRNLDKLKAVRDAIGAPSGIQLLTAAADDPAALESMARRAQVVISTVGPYQLFGSPLIVACARSGTDYVDLCGEPVWMRQMIDSYEELARKSGARIVFSCGFDSVPSDLGVLSLQTQAQVLTGHALNRVKCRIRKMQGGFSSGTLASLRANTTAATDPATMALLADPFALTPGFLGPTQPAGQTPQYDEDLGAWVAPFVMATINTRNVHRSNFLMGHRYGTDFVYDEMMVAGSGPQGEARAAGIAAAFTTLLSGTGGPEPGEGPSQAERDAGFYDMLFFGHAPDGTLVRFVVTGDGDPGYGSTPKIIGESAVCLVRDSADTPGGIWTAGAAMGGRLIDRLTCSAGLTFRLEGR
jgi:short subunit dehydrogenase-like uncharacterized protein